MASLDDTFADLRRWPDVEADNLFAYDATDRLILELAAPLLAGSNLAIIGDNYGALTVGAGTPSRVHQDELLGELALKANAKATGSAYTNHALGQSLLDGATLVLMQIPRTLAELEEQLDAIARYADPAVVVIAGGRIKHLTPAMNALMLRFFGRLDVSLAQQKSRAFTLRTPLPVGEPAYPKTELHRGVGLTVAAHGGVFAGTAIDIGTRLLLTTLPKITIDAGTAVDLGSGSGVLAASIARLKPAMRVIASDQSTAAVASTRLTAELNGVADRVEVVRDDGLALQRSGSVDLVLLNPPFHIGATVHTGLALRMFDEAARVLRPGGELWTVFNTHLGYRQALARIVGPTELVTHNAKFTVTVSRRA